jgi:hypothetical protein
MPRAAAAAVAVDLNESGAMTMSMRLIIAIAFTAQICPLTFDACSIGHSIGKLVSINRYKPGGCCL